MGSAVSVGHLNPSGQVWHVPFPLFDLYVPIRQLEQDAEPISLVTQTETLRICPFFWGNTSHIIPGMSSEL